MNGWLGGWVGFWSRGEVPASFWEAAPAPAAQVKMVNAQARILLMLLKNRRPEEWVRGLEGAGFAEPCEAPQGALDSRDMVTLFDFIPSWGS